MIPWGEVISQYSQGVFSMWLMGPMACLGAVPVGAACRVFSPQVLTTGVAHEAILLGSPQLAWAQ